MSDLSIMGKNGFSIYVDPNVAVPTCEERATALCCQKHGSADGRAMTSHKAAWIRELILLLPFRGRETV
ncbi:hypothetical protein VTO42DRAFT_4469 [Malbranchea cinnamomea]